MGKTRDLFKKIRDTKGTFHAKMDSGGASREEEEESGDPLGVMISSLTCLLLGDRPPAPRGCRA